MPRFVDLSHTITDSMVTYPGLPAPVIGDHLTRAHAEEVYGPGITFQIGMINMCANTGTYLDVPFHRYADGHDLCGLDLERVSQVDALLIDCRGVSSIGPAVLAGHELSGRAVLFRTDHSQRWGTEAYFEDHPFLDASTAEALVAAGVACVGIDSLNIDATSGGNRPVHSILLAAGVLIIEHLTTLDELPSSGFTFSAVPPKIEGMGTFTVRAHARLV